ncbi:hypothetical protein MRB56_14025 [Halomonas cupida]|uniref:hypothetical protein n=1 Tax=Halomonas cupida TaxID=44933 RepID=UPI0039B3D169
MLLLSNELASELSHENPKASVPAGGKTLCLYLGGGSAKLRGCGLLNVVLWDGDSASGLGVAELEGCHMKVKFQERMKKLNSSEIIGLSQNGDKIYLQHWEGFRTELDALSMEVISQQFTK